MPNQKRGRDTIVLKFRISHVTRRDLINIEKIILKKVKPADYYWQTEKEKKGVHRTQYSSARYLQKDIEVKYVEFNSKSPNIRGHISKKKIEIHIVRSYDKGDDLLDLNELSDQLKIYIENK